MDNADKMKYKNKTDYDVTLTREEIFLLKDLLTAQVAKYEGDVNFIMYCLDSDYYITEEEQEKQLDYIQQLSKEVDKISGIMQKFTESAHVNLNLKRDIIKDLYRIFGEY